MLLWRNLINYIVIKGQTVAGEEGVLRVLIYFPTKNSLSSLLLGPGLKLIFHCRTQWVILAKLFLKLVSTIFHYF